MTLTNEELQAKAKILADEVGQFEKDLNYIKKDHKGLDSGIAFFLYLSIFSLTQYLPIQDNRWVFAGTLAAILIMGTKVNRSEKKMSFLVSLLEKNGSLKRP